MGRRIAITGGRDFRNETLVNWAFRELGIGYGDMVVHGACRGADLICAKVAQLYGAETEAHPADWKKYGKAAGPVRNREMLESGIDLLIAFPGCRGTLNAVMTARNIGVPVWDLRGEE
jgi:hypothetical protein